jgi:DNA polymerase III subunit delta
MKANKGQIERALDSADAGVRLFLLHGPDEAGSRALMTRLERALGADVERIDLDAATLKTDPARLSDEAAAFSLFGGKRLIRVSGGGDEVMPAVDALLSGDVTGNPVVLIAGALKATNALLKRSLADDNVMAFASYLPDAADAGRLAIAMGREEGLRVGQEAARRLIAATGADRAVLAQELAKLALFLDAAPDRPVEVDGAALDAIGADAEEGDVGALVNAVLDGRADVAAREMALLGTADAIRTVKALADRLLMLARLRGDVEAGQSPAQVMENAGKAVFWKEKPIITRQLSRWTPERLRTAHARLADTRRAVMASGTAGPVLVEAELVAISRVAARLR